MQEFFGPSTEFAEEGIVIPKGKWKGEITGLDIAESKKAINVERERALFLKHGSDFHITNLVLNLKITECLECDNDEEMFPNLSSEGSLGKPVTIYVPLQGSRSGALTRLLAQAGLSDIGRILDAKHPDYDPKAANFQAATAEDSWALVKALLTNGEVEDVEGRPLVSAEGGLIGKRVEFSTGAPKKRKDEDGNELDEWQTNFPNISKAAWR